MYLTDKCQQRCTHCATGSSPEGTHGTMTTADWKRVLDQAAELWVRRVQFIGGEPMLHPGLAELVGHALGHALEVEVFSNLVWVPEALWPILSQPGVSLATSYYSDRPEQHAGITGVDTLPRIRATIARATGLGIPLRAGVIDLGVGQRFEQATRNLVDLGVPSIGHDRVRALGRAAPCTTGGSNAAELCGRCGDGQATIAPDGQVRPCLFVTWATAGNVRERGLGEVVAAMPGVRAELIAQGMPTTLAGNCQPDGNCYPYNDR
ncbi:radical SAM protein [Saccharothrix syringae]|uniref:Radical SAM protein n=1 Tax=Saccharothrix syringae TaxID=103733 RepID=A0A5Q0HFW4_SACSY|nr:radical SAM protein [Saccharothrix syringae]